MTLHRENLPAWSGPGPLRFRFPPLPEDGSARPDRASALSPEPAALLSLRASGNLRYRGPGANPNRERFLRGLGFGPGRLVGIELRHTRRVLFLDRLPSGAAHDGAYERDGLELAGISPAEAAEDPRCEGDGGPDGAAGVDGLLTRDRGALPCVTVADCMPIWLLDRGSGYFGVLHSGWKGTGILAAAAHGLVRLQGADPALMVAILGPSIGACCYRVPEERAGTFARGFGEDAVLRGEDGPRLDLRQANIALARRLGLGALLSVEACTACDDRLGSFRREGPEDFTRMLALVGDLGGGEA